ncbi:serpin A12-like protein [Dinothrombium tinctorium]|uniref:Serpin A12-like protein n=1 Tax=Dinothrombium tinctorium TaxID=1965070 RepID=A0A3S3NEG5_9ACAR|nr:serpin A12-like protein [Dinothrombium tinctorium]
MSLSNPTLLFRLYEEEIERSISPRSETKINGAIDYTFNYNMKLLHLFTKTGQSFAISPLAMTTSFVSLIVTFSDKTRKQLCRSIFNIDDLNEEEENLMLQQTNLHLDLILRNATDSMDFNLFLFIDEEYDIFPEYEKLFAETLRMQVKYINFRSNASQQINQLIGQDEITVSTEANMLLVGVTAFSPFWRKRLQKSEDLLAFHNEDSTISFTRFLYGRGIYRIGRDQKFKCTVLEMRLECHQMRMEWQNMSVVFYLPDEEMDINSISQASKNECICEDISRMIDTSSFPFEDVCVWIPEFRLHTKENMKPFIRELGINLMFDSESKNRLRVAKDTSSQCFILDDIVQICTFETKANAVKQEDEDIDDCSLFICNRPFMFAVTAVIRGNKVIIYQGLINKLLTQY